jgi:site-specific DNA recombinase
MTKKIGAVIHDSVIYARTSSVRDNEKNNSCNQQVKILQRLIPKDKEKLVGVYVDSCISGNEYNRPGLQGLIRDARRGRFEKVYVQDYARLSRNKEMLREIEDEFVNLGIIVSYARLSETNPTGYEIYKVWCPKSREK